MRNEMELPQIRGFFLAFVCALCMCVFSLVGCGNSVGTGTVTSEVIEETGAFKAVADNAKLDEVVSLDNGVTITDADVLMISPNFTQGKAEVDLSDASGNTVFAQEVEGRVLDTYEVKPGTYNVKVTIKEAGTTGELVICPNNAEEFDAMNESLEKTLEENNIEM